MNSQYIGITLMFALRTGGKMEGELQSYALPFRSRKTARQEILSSAEEIGTAQVTGTVAAGDEDFVDYLGIEDLFCVVGPLRNGALLSRSTLYSQTPADASALIIAPEHFDYHDSGWPNRGEYVADAVFFVDDLQDEEMRRIIVASALVTARQQGQVVESASMVVQSMDFKQKIVQLDIDGLAIDELQFVGFEDINLVVEDIHQNGAYAILVKEIESIDEIRNQLLDEKEIRDFFKSEGLA